MTYSLDFRKKVLKIEAKEKLTIAEAAERFGIGTATITRWKQRIVPIRSRKVTPHKLPIKKLLEDVEKYPDSYQRERAKRLGVGKSTIHQALQKLKITHKKKH